MLNLKPFTENQLKHKFHINQFTENNLKFAVGIYEEEFESRFDFYKFGVKDKQGNLFWCWNAKTMAKTRIDAIELYNHLLVYCSDNDLGIPFAFKPGVLKKKKE